MSRRGYAKLALIVVGALAMMALVIVAGCGSSTSSSPSPTATASESASASTGTGADVAHATQALTGLDAVPTFKPAGDPFDAKKVMAGKAILSVPGTGTDPFYVQMNAGMKWAADQVGYKFSVWNNQGQLTQYQQGIQQGITQKVAVIDLLAGPDPNALKPQIDAAKKAGVLVVSSHLSGLEQTVPNVSDNLPIDYNLAGRLLADWVITKDTKAHVLVIVSDEIVSTGAMRDGISSEFNKYGGPDIKYAFTNVPIPDWGTKIKPVVQSAIVADPQLTYIICIYDSMSQFVTPAIDATNSVGKVKVIGFNGTPFVLDLVRTGKVEMDLGESLNWAGTAIADAEMRLIGGMGLVPSMNIPFRLFTQANAADAGIPAEFSKGYGDFKDQYRKLWGL
jgi:ribose transport system substrate-binding protein